MAVPFQHRRMNSATRALYTILISEFVYDTDSDEVYVGDGVTAGGLLVGGGGGSTLVPVINKTSNFVAAGAETGTRYTNTGAGGTVVGTLPAATVGLAFGLSISATQILRFDAAGTDTINYAGTASAAGGVIEGNVIGWFLMIECHVTGRWTVTNVQGGWTVT